MIPIRVAHTAHGAGNCPMTMAVDMGYFSEEGLDVRRAAGASTAPLVDRLVAGECEFAITAGVPVLRAVDRGARLAVLASLVSRNLFAVVARPGIAISDIPGASLGVTGPYDQDGIVLRKALREWSVGENDVRLVSLKNRARLWENLESGAIAAFAVTPPLSIRAELAGYPLLRDFAVDSPPYQLGSLVTTRDLLERSRDIGVRFVRALLRGIAAFQGSLDDAMPHLKACTDLVDEAVLSRTHTVFAREMIECRPRPEALANVKHDIEAADGAVLDVKLGHLVDVSVFDEARSR